MPNLFAPNDLHLTVIDRELENQRGRTVAGMAHFAGTGPANATCRECVHWTGCGESTGYAAKKIGGGQIKPRACAQFKSMMRGQIGGKIPYDVAACKYFDRNPSPPPAYEGRS